MMAIWRWTRLLLLLLMPSFMCFFLGSSLEEDGSGFLNSTNHMYSTEEASLALSHNILTQTPQSPLLYGRNVHTRFALFQAWGLRHKRPRCKTGNSIDDCWRCDHNWAWNRKRLADCAIGFGRHAIGGKNGEFYMVVDSSDKDPANPKIGTLRHAVIQTEPLWIIFISSMEIRLRQELLVNSYKTIDGRGSNIHISGGPCITVQNAHHVIIHGIHIHDCVPSKKGMIRSSPTHVSWHSPSDGDGIHVYGSYHIWIDHCSLSQCTDGLIDVTHGSTFTTISNNYFTNHDKVMLLGHSDTYVADKKMQVTVAYNHFGKGLVQRMPRCRHGFFEILNNEYIEWKMYAIGGSAQPTINSKGNRFLAPDVKDSKQVTKRMHAPNNVWRSWNWRTQGDLFLNGAYFVQSGSFSSPNYLKAATTGPKPCKWVEAMTTNAGPFDCKEGSSC